MKKLRVIIGCEHSGTTRREFRKRGHDAWSCDILPASDQSPYHIQGDVLSVLNQGWDIGIFHPPCTHLSLSGARWCVDHWVKNKRKGDWWWDGTEKRRLRALAVQFFKDLLNAPIDKICLENPMSTASTLVRKYDQVIQPYEYGHGERKTTWLWLKNLPLLVPTNIVAGRESKVHGMTPSKDRGHLRSISYPGISRAMAEQWG